MSALALVLDGVLVAADAPAFPPLERGLLYGDGLFEALPVFGGGALDGPRHFSRMTASCGALGFPVPSRAAWDRAIGLSLHAAGTAADSLRVTWTRGEAHARGFAPGVDDGPPRLLVAAFGAPAGRDARLREGVSAMTVRGLMPGELACHKTLSAMTYVVAQSRACAAGAEEAILTDPEGRVLECAGANLFVVRAGRSLTPPAVRPILAGIARERVIGWLAGRWQEADFRPGDVAVADEAFLTNAVRGVTPLVRIDGEAIGSGAPGPLTRELQRRWREWCEAAAATSTGQDQESS